MIKKITLISYTIAIALFLVSCRDTKQKMQAYVNSFNNSSEYFRNDIITKANAKALFAEKKVVINVETNLEANPTNQSVYSQMFPGLLGEMLKKDHASMELIEEGVTFEMSFLANDNSTLAELKVDQKELNKILNQKGTNLLNKTEASGSGSNSQLQEMLAIMNKNMPIVNQDGTKILKIEISDKNEMLYKIEVPKQYAEVLKGEGAKVLMKESILRSNDLKAIISSIHRYGITAIKYEYLDSKGKPVNDIVLTEKDLK